MNDKKQANQEAFYFATPTGDACENSKEAKSSFSAQAYNEFACVQQTKTLVNRQESIDGRHFF